MLEGVAVQSDGTILLAGYTSGDWDGLNAGGTLGSPRDFAAVMLAANGTELWRYQVRTYRRMLPTAAELPAP